VIIPNDFEELFRFWEGTIRSSGSKDPLKMAFQIFQEGFLKHSFTGSHDFKIKLSRRVRQKIKEQECCAFERPEDVPCENSRFQREFDSIVRKAISRVIPFNAWGEDLVQHIWTKVLEVDLLTMFLSHCSKKLPENLSEREVVDYLGIPWYDWESFLKKAGLIRGPARRQAYSRDEVLAFEASTQLQVGKLPRRLPVGSCNRKRLSNYLSMAVGNHARNYLRTNERRFSKEHTLKMNVTLSPSSVGTFITSSMASDSMVSESPSWDSILPDMKSSPVDVTADINRVANSFGFDLSTDQGFEGFLSKLQFIAKRAKLAGIDPASAQFGRMLMSASA